MSLYGHTQIDVTALKRWVNSLSVDTLSQIDIGGNSVDITGNVRELLRTQTQAVVELINHLNPEDDWRVFENIMSPIFYSAFMRVSNSSIRIANFYECLVVPSNMKTYKKIIEGFDYIDIGAIHIHDDQGNALATIGQKSDLIWSVFYEYFINKDEYGSINHTYSNHEQYLSLQLFNTEHFSLDEIFSFVTEILIRISIEYDMEFKIFEVDPMFKQQGNNLIYKLEFSPAGFAQIPMLYFVNAINSADERLSYLSYYQVIEYFFVRAQNNYFLNEFSNIDPQNVDHNKLRKVLESYRKTSNERAALGLVFTRAITVSSFKHWLNSSPKYQTVYCNSATLKIDISKADNKIIGQLVDRVYSYRCSIAHAKGDIEEYIAIPSLSKYQISDELPLLKYLAFEVLGCYS